jgi:hypothetical protein
MRGRFVKEEGQADGYDPCYHQGSGHDPEY